METKANRNMTKEWYEDTSGHYIEVTMFEKGYEMTMDKERAEYTEETIIAGSKAVIITKNGITTIFLYQNEILFEIESNLLLEDFIEAAEHLQIKD